MHDPVLYLVVQPWGAQPRNSPEDFGDWLVGHPWNSRPQDDATCCRQATGGIPPGEPNVLGWSFVHRYWISTRWHGCHVEDSMSITIGILLRVRCCSPATIRSVMTNMLTTSAGDLLKRYRPVTIGKVVIHQVTSLPTGTWTKF